ncbi:hypothetical protein H0H92_000590 [Tricholoma furcatifolium]|nr:hypothetical protein H0H92_000590 [Tricholoma furcatifolium]
MFGTLALTAFLASTSLLVRADAIPSDPGPGVVYQVGGTCHITWIGDTNSTTAWQNMAIELMTGDNFEMIHLTTVATGQDGTQDGTFDHICPGVTPNAAIYFYQFTAPAASDKQWTTRFTIAAADGSTTQPTNATQPDGEAIPWGTGALTDPSTAVAAPDFAAAASSGAASTGAATTVAGTTVVATAAIAATVPAVSSMVTITNSAATAAASSAATTSSANTTTSAQGNGAASLAVNSRVWQAAVALGASTAAFALLF